MSRLDTDNRTTNIEVRGARVHNLQGIDVDLPHGAFVVLTGVSGSGKSTLAFDTIHAESRRRYLESLGPAARGIFEAIEPPDADRIDGLSPTVAVDAHPGAPSPRSTVGTLTETLDYLRILYARAGVPHCPRCDRPIAAQDLESILGDVLARPEGTKIIVLAPLLRPGASPKSALDAVRKAGLLRARVDGEMIEVESAPAWTDSASTVDAVIDRLVVRPGIRPRLAESLELALRLGEGIALLSTPGPEGSWTDEVRSTQHACPTCRIAVPRREPSGFSFNTPQGACPTCQGLGRRSRLDPALALGPAWNQPWAALDPEDLPIRKVIRPLQAQALDDLILKRTPAKRKGAPKRKPTAPNTAERLWPDTPDGPGLESLLESWANDARSRRVASALAAFRVEETCPDCHGARLNAEARGVRLAGLGLHELSSRNLDEAASFLQNLPFPPTLAAAGPPLVREVLLRLEFLRRVGLGYLSLDRAADTLSGGERHRVRLAARMGAGLTGVTYILDEPTSGLHPADTQRLLDCLIDLRDAGNTVIVVEHDLDVIRAADWVIDLGPGAGPDGGRIVASGPPDTLSGEDSITTRYLHALKATGKANGDRPKARETGTGSESARCLSPFPDEDPQARETGTGSESARCLSPFPDEDPQARETGTGSESARCLSPFPDDDPQARETGTGSESARCLSPFPDDTAGSTGDRRWVTIAGIRAHNLAGDATRFPIGGFTCVTGVSGSGKSTLVLDILAPALRLRLREGPTAPIEGINGLDAFDRLLLIDQAPIGRGVRSTPATYTGAFDALRKLYSKTKEARVRGFGPSRFSFNAPDGRCEVCLGQGVRRLDPRLLPEVAVPCEACGGSRFAPSSLEVRYRDLSIADALALRVDEAVTLFDAIPDVARPLRALHQAGLGYITLGQSSPTLSGGEAQRVKLAAELAQATPGRTLTILDEPTTGLHPADVARLLDTLRGLRPMGHTLVVIEHHLDVIRDADWIIDLGPGAGPQGGRVVAQGPPSDVAAVPESRTGAALAGRSGTLGKPIKPRDRS